MTQPLPPEPFTYHLDPRAATYYGGLEPGHLDPARVDWAISDTITRIEEWSYEQDAHGYCHDRTDMIALVMEIRRLQQMLHDSSYSYRPEDVVQFRCTWCTCDKDTQCEHCSGGQRFSWGRA